MYIVSFDIVAIFLASILLIVHWILFDNKNTTNRLYQAFLVSTVVESILDLYTAKCIDHVLIRSDISNMLMNSFYLFVTICTAFLGYRLLSYKYEHINRHSILTSNFVFVLGIIMLIYNFFTGFFFDFVDGNYIKKDLFILIDLASFLLLFLIVLLMFFLGKQKGLRELKMPLFFVLIIMSTFIVQLIFPQILLVAFGKAMAGMGYCLYLDSPEHLKLIAAVNQLKESQIKQIETLEILDDANRQKTDFLVKMSHELKTPINAILGLDEMLCSECEEKEVLEEAEHLNKYGKELLELVEKVVDFSQLETGKLEIRQTEYEFIDAYLNMDERLRKICDAEGFRFIHTVSEEVPKRLYGDKNRISQIMEALVKMSIADLESGELDITLKVDHIEDDAVYIEIVIESSGELDSNPACIDDNSLNYMIIEEIAECMTCELEYDEMDKSHIRIVYPQEIVDLKPVGNLVVAAEHFRKMYGKSRDSSVFTMPTAKILVVDDVEINLEVVEGLLRPFNVNVTKACSGAEALKLMRQEEFDLVFMDIMMPEMDGIETLHQIRQNELIVSKNVIAIALTANSFLGAHDRYISEGFADYIPKPVNRQRLAMALKQFLPDKLEKDWAELEVTEGDETPKKTLTVTEYNEKETVISLAEKKETGDVVNLGAEVTKAALPLSLKEVDGLDYERAIDAFEGDEELYMEVLSEYCSNDIVIELETYYEASDWENYRILIHGLKSSSMSVGFTRLSEMARELESAAKEGNIQYIEDNHDEWITEYARILGIVNALI